MKKIACILLFTCLSFLIFAQDLTIHFQFDKAKIDSSSSKSLKEFIQTNNPDKIILKGYADTTGAADYNKKLVAKRLSAVEHTIHAIKKDIKINKINFGEHKSAGDDISFRKVEIFLDQIGYKLIEPNYKNAQTFVIDNKNDTIIKCNEGTQIKIPRNSFVIKASEEKPQGLVELHVTEYYKLPEIIDAHLSTQSHEEILETGGMLYMQAFSGNKECELKKGSKIGLSFKDVTEKDSMMIFSGRIADDYMDWEPGNEESKEDYPEEVFFIVENMPTFLGGDLSSFKNYVVSKLKYPKIAAEEGIQGTVYVQFTIDANGLLINPTIVRGVHPSLDYEVLRVLNNTPAWQAAKQRGNPVAVQFTMPITFSLEDNLPIDNNNRISTPTDFAKAIENDSAIQQNKETNELITDYYLWTNKLSWINCDRFYMYPKRSNLKVHAESEYESYFAIFNENRSIMRPDKYNAKLKIRQFVNIPVNMEVLIVGLKITDKEVYFTKFMAKADGQIYQPVFEKIDKVTLTERLEETGL